jgi:hypothetical protein
VRALTHITPSSHHDKDTADQHLNAVRTPATNQLRRMEDSPPHLAMLATPGMGQLIPQAELAKRVAARCCGK